VPEAGLSAPRGLLPDWLDDVVVEFAAIPAALEDASARGVLWSAAPGRLWLEVPGVGRYLADQGRSLLVDPAPSADPQTVARLARATPLAALCYQRGLVALHAATAVRDGVAVILAGDSATGKSTLLAALLARGWKMLGDEVAPLAAADSDAVAVLPTGDELRLWPDAAARLATDAGLGHLPSLDPDSPGGPQMLATEDRALGLPAPLHAIWRLSLHNRPGIQVDAVNGFEGFEWLGKLAYRGRMAHALLDRGAYLRIAAAIASTVALRHAHRPRGEWSVEQLAVIVEQDADRSGNSR
jgi:hypothetical protein